MALVDGADLALIGFSPLFLPFLGLGDVLRLRRRVRGRRHFVGVVGVPTGGDPLFLGEAGELVLVEALRRARARGAPGGTAQRSRLALTLRLLRY